jgi:hypothetical protein
MGFFKDNAVLNKRLYVLGVLFIQKISSSLKVWYNRLNNKILARRNGDIWLKNWNIGLRLSLHPFFL